jgi:site-specific DNA recombinase
MRVLGYARVSSEEQSKGTSLQDQQDAIKAYAKTRGVAVHRFYVEAESAVYERIEKRQQIQQLLKEARSGDLVVCDKLDRWSRDAEFTYGSIRRLLEAGIAFYAVGDRCDPGTRDGDTMLGVRVLVAREEHKRIKERTVGTRRLLRDRGYYIDGLVPLGYVRPPRKEVSRLEHNVLQVDPDRAAIVRDMFRRCIRGESVGSILQWLSQTHTYRKWDKKLVGKTLRHRIYLGEVRDTKGTWIKGLHEALIPPDVFARAQVALDSRRLTGSAPRAESRTKTWLLRELGRCGLCGAKLSASYGGGTYTGPKNYTYYYRCVRGCDESRYMRVEEFDPLVADMILARLVELKDELARGPEPRKEATVDLAAERLKLQRKRERFIEAFADAGMTKEELRTALARVDEARTKLDAMDLKPVATPEAHRAALAKVENIRLAWARASWPIRRLALHELATAVRVEWGETPEVLWKTAEEIAYEG